MRLVLAALLSVSQAAAEPLVDLRLLFAQHEDQVVVKDNGSSVYRELTLGDGVVTRCKGEGYDACVSVDANGRGDTTDCSLVYSVRTLLVARDCGFGSALSRTALENVLDTLGEHVAANAVPPRDWHTLRDLVLERALRDPLPTCGQIEEVGKSFFVSRLAMDNLQELQAMAATPRLPVGGCLD